MAGLPDVMFSNQKFQFVSILEGLKIKKRLVYSTYGNLDYFTAILYIVWPFGNVVVIWYILPRFGILCGRKIWQPCLMAQF
jgi:hypothetical protein